MAVEFDARPLRGPWTAGYALDLHTISSTLVGYSPSGHEVFETKRPPVGELLYRLKNRNDRSAVQPLVEALVKFVTSWNIVVDAIVPVPPSNARRRLQPVMEVATALSASKGSAHG